MASENPKIKRFFLTPATLNFQEIFVNEFELNLSDCSLKKKSFLKGFFLNQTERGHFTPFFPSLKTYGK